MRVSIAAADYLELLRIEGIITDMLHLLIRASYADTEIRFEKTTPGIVIVHFSSGDDLNARSVPDGVSPDVWFSLIMKRFENLLLASGRAPLISGPIIEDKGRSYRYVLRFDGTDEEEDS